MKKIILLLVLMSTTILAGGRLGSFGVGGSSVGTFGAGFFSPQQALGSSSSLYPTLRYAHGDRNGTTYTRSSTDYEQIGITREIEDSHGEIDIATNSLIKAGDASPRIIIVQSESLSVSDVTNTAINEFTDPSTTGTTYSYGEVWDNNGGLSSLQSAIVTSVADRYYGYRNDGASGDTYSGAADDFYIKSVGLQELGASLSGDSYFNVLTGTDLTLFGSNPKTTMTMVTERTAVGTSLNGSGHVPIKAGWWLLNASAFIKNPTDDNKRFFRMEIFDTTDSDIIATATGGEQDGIAAWILYEADGTETISITVKQADSLTIDLAQVQGFYLGTREDLPASDYLHVTRTGSTKVITEGTTTTDLYNNEVTSSGQWASNQYTAPSDGYFAVAHANATTNYSTAGVRKRSILKVNGTAVQTVTKGDGKVQSGVVASSATGFDVLKLSSGDTVKVDHESFNVASGTWSVAAGSDTENYLQIMKVGEY